MDRDFVPLWSVGGEIEREQGVIDLSEHPQLLQVFHEHPYVEDVLEWLVGRRRFSQIRHDFLEEDFDHKVLPRLLSWLYRLGFLTLRGGHPAPIFRNWSFLNIPDSRDLGEKRARAILDGLLSRARFSGSDFSSGYFRTRASPQKIQEWKSKIDEVVNDIESHADIYGVPFSINVFSLSGR